MWFKYLIFALFIGETIIYLARMGGWKPERGGPGVCFVVAVLSALIATGIWFWL
ncbi:unnamed protein product [marine sediment metagenome]|uniref:Uncharacterized protein n=1 Tax=marine sediment metagenome TaxID=412755 RepID=X1N1F2_9ZZZZ